MSDDYKIKTAASKPPLALVPQRALIGPSRVFGYGGKVYAPGNFLNASLSDGAGQRYVSAALRHLSEMQESNGLHTPESLAAVDLESGLPHIDHVICGMIMLRSIMVKDGALTVDPGIGKDPPRREIVAPACVLPTDDMCDCRDCVRRSTFGAIDRAEWNVPLSVSRDVPDDRR